MRESKGWLNPKAQTKVNKLKNFNFFARADLYSLLRPGRGGWGFTLFSPTLGRPKTARRRPGARRLPSPCLHGYAGRAAGTLSALVSTRKMVNYAWPG